MSSDSGARRALRKAGLAPAGDVPFVRSPDADPFPGGESVWVDPEFEVAVLVEPGGGLACAWLDVAWPGPGSPARSLRQLAEVPDDGDDLPKSLAGALDLARRQRGKALRRCRYCGERHLPGHMQTDDVCQGCAESELGVVH